MRELHWMTASELNEAFRLGETSPQDVVIALETRFDALASDLNAFQMVDFDAAYRAAEASSRRWRSGCPLGPLDGVPVSVKDTVDAAGWPTRKGSRTTANAGNAEDDALSVARLRAAGAVLFGKTHVPEFAWKALTQSPMNGATRNPWDFARNSGGSTGGGAAAVAAGLGPLAHGTDGGGSLRMPSSFCGTVGFKPTNGTVPYLPQQGPAATFVVEGPIARSVRDAAVMTEIMRQQDRRDPLALPFDPSRWTDLDNSPLSQFRFAYSPGFAGAEPDSDTLAATNLAIAQLRDKGATIDEIGPVVAPLQPRFEPYWLASMAQALKQIPEEMWELLDPTFVDIGRSGLTLGPEAVWNGLQEQLKLRYEMAILHERYPLLLTPTMLDITPPADTPYHQGAFTRWSATTYVLPASTTGQPAIALPAGLARDMPVGLQLMARRYADHELLRAASAVEEVLDWPLPHPKLDSKLGQAGAA